MNFDAHPIRFLQKVFPLYRECMLEFSHYKYKPQSLMDERTCFSLSSIEFTDDWLKEKLFSLQPEEELAIHSVVKVNEKTFHLPMIDFDCLEGDLDRAKDILSKLLPNFVSAGLQYYNSGRSFHAYGAALLRPKEWTGFMGRLLLCNLPGEPQIVDARWIGHRLIGGYSSLRLSCNTPSYLNLPSLVESES